LGESSPAVLGLIAVLMARAVAFSAESHDGNPLIDLRLLSDKFIRPRRCPIFAQWRSRHATGGIVADPTSSGALIAAGGTDGHWPTWSPSWPAVGPRNPTLLSCKIAGLGILLTTFTSLLAKQYIVVAFVGFALFGIGLGFYATPSTDAALSNVPNEKAGSASGIYKMASSLGAAFGVAISAAIFTSLSHMEGLSPMAEIALGRTDNLAVRYAAAIALLFNVLMVVVAMIAIMWTIPKGNSQVSGTPAA